MSRIINPSSPIYQHFPARQENPASTKSESQQQEQLPPQPKQQPPQQRQLLLPGDKTDIEERVQLMKDFSDGVRNGGQFTLHAIKHVGGKYLVGKCRIGHYFPITTAMICNRQRVNLCKFCNEQSTPDEIQDKIAILAKTIADKVVRPKRFSFVEHKPENKIDPTTEAILHKRVDQPKLPRNPFQSRLDSEQQDKFDNCVHVQPVSSPIQPASIPIQPAAIPNQPSSFQFFAPTEFVVQSHQKTFQLEHKKMETHLEQINTNSQIPIPPENKVELIDLTKSSPPLNGHTSQISRWPPTAQSQKKYRNGRGYLLHGREIPIPMSLADIQFTNQFFAEDMDVGLKEIRRKTFERVKAANPDTYKLYYPALCREFDLWY
jgi:hypothetical protein